MSSSNYSIVNTANNVLFMKKNIIRITILTFFLKIVYFAFALIVSEFKPNYHIECNKTEFFSLFKRNDSSWYQKAAEEGYPKITNPLDLGYSNGKDFRQSVWAQFPFYPLCIRFIEKGLHLDFNYSAFILSIIFSVSGFIAFYLLCIAVFKINIDDSFVYTLFFMCFPFHYYYSMYYTEAVFFTFLGFSFIFIAQKKYGLMSIMLVPLVLVRPNGIVCLLPLFIYFLEEGGGFYQFYSDIKTFNWQKIRNVLYFASAPIAFGLYCMYQKEMTDHYFAFAKAQAGWYKEFMFPLLAFFRNGEFFTQFNSIYTIAVMLVAIATWKKFPLSQNIFIWLTILLPLSSGSVVSMPRYISVIFPLMIYGSSFFVNTKWKYYFVFAALIAQLITFYPWLISHPFSY